MRVRSAVTASLPILLAGACDCPQPAVKPDCPVAAEGEYRHKATFWYFVENIQADPAQGKTPAVLLWVALPRDRPGQEARVVGFDPQPTEILEDPAAGNRVALWRVENPGASLVFRYDAEIVNRSVVSDVDPARVRRADPASFEMRRFTVSEPWLEASEAIAGKAREIVGDERNPYLQARKVFDWVVAHMTYDYPAMEERGVTRAFATMRGDCGEFSHIFETMMRSLGVPARAVVAHWYQGGGHAWAEVFLPPYGWVPVDTSVAQLVSNRLKGQMSEGEVAKFIDTRGIPGRDPRWLFGNLYPNRLEIFVGENVRFDGRTPGALRTFTFMQPGGTGALPQGVAFEGLAGTVASGGFFLFDAESGDLVRARDRADEELASAYASAGLFDRAVAGLRRKLARSPADAQALFQLGQAYFDQGKWPEAGDAFRQELKGEGGGSTRRTIDTWSHILLGMSLDARGKRDEAVIEYQAALNIGADHSGSMATARKLLAEPFKPGAKQE